MTALAESKYGKFYHFDYDVIGRSIASGAFWDGHFKPWMDKVGNGVMVDVGANIGFFTIYCALRGGWVWAFEASPEVFGMLKKNVELNRVELNVRLENVALYDKKQELKLNPEWDDWKATSDGKVDYERMSNSGGMSFVPGDGGPYVTMARTLDSYSLLRCDLIKTDTQGADLQVLLGAKHTIEKFRPVVCFEVEPATSERVQAQLQFFESVNYTVQLLNVGQYNKDFVAVPCG